MVPIATVGFITSGILFSVYAFTFLTQVSRKIKTSLSSFAYAYFCLSLAFLIWGLAAFLNNQKFLETSVILGNFLLLLGSCFMVNLGLNTLKGRVGILIGAVLISVLFLWWRINYYPPKPYLDDGILLFNTESPVVIILGLMILVIWLPASLKVAKIIADTLKIKSLAFIYSSIYIMATIGALIFIAAKTPLMVVLSFVGILLCFIMLLISNFLITKLVK